MNEDIRLQLTKIGNDAKKASNALSMASEDKKNQALMNFTSLLSILLNGSRRPLQYFIAYRENKFVSPSPRAK